jgi:molybdate transport system substrate-binding protein
MHHRRICVCLVVLWALVGLARGDIYVFAAASTVEAMREVAVEYEGLYPGTPVHFNVAGSGTLARQIEAGAHADCFVSADQRWMDYLAQRDLLKDGTRFDMAGNRLVLAVPAGSTLKLDGLPGAIPAGGKIAVGDFRTVPVGAYAREALERMGLLEALTPHLVFADNTRTVLMHVVRGEVEAGIVYATDARLSRAVEVAAVFPADAHSLIVYPVACLADASQEALLFLDFLKTEQALAIWLKFGFSRAGEGVEP